MRCVLVQLNDTFRDIQRKLFEKANSAEDLAEHREWMKSVPELLDDKKVLDFVRTTSHSFIRALLAGRYPQNH